MFRSDAGVRVKRALLVLASGVLVLAGAGLVYQYIATAMDHSRFPAPGELVDVGGYELHIHCMAQACLP